MLQVTAQRKGLVFNVEVDPGVPTLLGDPVRLRQVLLNLAQNAVKFTVRGRVDLLVRKLRTRPERVLLGFAVHDTGIGIPREQMKKILEPFSQAENLHGRRLDGVGLGLTISRQLVELMGGQIDIDSVPGQGSTFHFSLELAVAADSNRPDADGMTDGTAPALVGCRILVVDDDYWSRQIEAELIRDMGANVRVAANGEEALKRVAQETFDIVLLDLRMPGMDGLETMRRLRQRVRKRPVVIAMTASSTAEERQACRAAGMDDFLPKPIEIKALGRLLVTWWGRVTRAQGVSG